MKNNYVAILAATVAGLSMGSVAYSAQITGKVTQANGITPMANVRVALYKFDPTTGGFNYNGSTLTNSNGAFTAIPWDSNSAMHPGSYYLVFGSSSWSSSSYPFFYSSDFYSSDPSANYYVETYDDVTPLTPNKLPALVAISTPTQSVALPKIVKLNPKPNSCLITGPMTINGVSYSNFSYYNDTGGPKLPAAGGALTVSFTVQNPGATPIETTVQPLAFLERQDGAFKGNRSVATLTTKAVTLPANSTTTVTLNTTIPASFMTASPRSYSSIPPMWAFNVGINAVAANGLANCFSMPVFPVLRTTPLATSQDLAPESEQQPLGPTIPLVLDKDGKPVKFGPIPK
ncbi:MAG: carboxypeptidase-like regulatory domain-containing protein [Candidatus Contendobacter sp.]|nr:carboxypeptidase-like regulatory domain-containing protein [Candidatus Contendobacter sp.]